ncbi:acetyltransferase [Xenorhabdus mauleonii]|uniref:Acetyltransferase n=1 Tax=Xenorhabdus mauleonii TaxID=351675 RepID=A0A1I3SUZ1_9GAMM|nr:GNAT family N-acetyltransferase [Xenorhabdus mauleonii]PHM44635.1 acetyltransferase [Xenorhabdus mauleonii]SFJ62648.1 Acetyltransferase (GNAT) family protein [Xenorhabdus mauleonii]
MNKMKYFTVTNATLQDWRKIIEWGNREGWNAGYQDAACAYQIDPKGLFIGWLDNKIIAAVSLINHSEKYSIWGSYLVHPEYRGKGYGKAICKIARVHAGNREIGSNAMPEMTSNYMKSGLVSVHKIIHYAGRVKRKKINPLNKTNKIFPIEPHHLDIITDYDAIFFPTSRKRFLQNWLFSAGHKSHVKFDNGEITGYGVIRPAPQGYKIGPLAATTPDDAQDLFDSLTADLNPTDNISIFVPDYASEKFTSSLRYKGLSSQFHVVYMHKGSIYKNMNEIIYSPANLEMG